MRTSFSFFLFFKIVVLGRFQVEKWGLIFEEKKIIFRDKKNKNKNKNNNNNQKTMPS